MRSKFFIILTILILAGNLKLQAQKKTVLVEHFTNTKCPICRNNNPGFYTRFDKYKEDAIHIAYHPSVPYNSCELYLANKEGNGARQSHYNIFGTPTAFVNGLPGSSSLPTDNDYVNAIAEVAEYEIEFNSALSSEVAVKIRTLKDLPDGATLTLHTALTENLVNFNAPNGEKQHFDVFRKFINDTNNGVTVNFAAGAKAGDTKDHSFGGISYGSPDWSGFRLIAFINKSGQKAILQSAKSNINETASNATINVREVGVTNYPNPVNEEMTIKWEAKDFNPDQISIYKSDGQLLMNKSFSASGNELKINIGKNTPGLYLYKLHSENSKIVGHGKFIVK